MLRRSLGEAALTDSILEDEIVTYDVIEEGSIRMKKKLVSSDGYSFTIKVSSDVKCKY